MDLLQALQWIQAVLFASLAIAGLGSWLQHRTAPAGYVAAAFGAIALVTLTSRVSSLVVDAPPEPIVDLQIATLVAFPWLLAAFAWSFVGPLPRWLRATGIISAVVAVAVFLLPPLEGGTSRAGWELAYLAALMTLWLGLNGATAGHLWLAGRGQRIVRARTRLLALGAIVLAVALLIAAAFDGVDDRNIATITTALTIASALLFAAGFVPPAPLRLYWRQVPGQQMHEMQTALVAAVTPDQVAAAVTPVLADTFGGGAVCTDPQHRVVARSGMSDADVERIQRHLAGQGPPVPMVQILEADGWHLAVQTSPYAPLFGEDERGLLARYGLQLRLGLQRADLFVAHAEARAEVEEASRDLQEMLVGLAHDLRSPAVTISTYAALLSDARDEQDRELMIEGIRDGSAYLDRLVDGLVSLSRIGRKDGEPEPVDLGEVVRGVARLLGVRYPDLEVVIPDGLPTVCMDRLRIEQVIDNLLGNAAKHGGRADLTVDVSWEPDGSGGGVLVLADDGRGVPEAERETVFGLFRRGTTSASGSGVGLGLVRRVIESHGGHVRLAPSDRGARVEVMLPGTLVVATQDQARRSDSVGTRRDGS